MTEFKSFDELWEKCESLSKPASEEEIISEILLKIKLYSAVKSSSDNLEVKTRLFGEILFCLAQLSDLNKINIFAGLYQTLQYKLS